MCVFASLLPFQDAVGSVLQLTHLQQGRFTPANESVIRERLFASLSQLDAVHHALIQQAER